MKLITALLMAFVLSLAAPAAAQTRTSDLATKSLEDLLNVTITTATLNAEGAAEAPARVQVVTADQIQRRGYRSLMELLQDLPDVKVDLRGDQDYPSQIVIQGSRGSDRVVVLLDGVRISSPTNEPLPILANYPVHAARQVEIVYGPASALYGADAFSAVINIISREAGATPEVRATMSFGQFGLYDQAATFTGRIGSASVLVAAQAQHDAQPDLSRYYPADFGDMAAQRTGTFNTIFGPMTAPGPVSPGFSMPLTAHSIQSVVHAAGWQFVLFQSESRASTSPVYTPDNAIYNAGIFNRNTLFVGSAGYTRRLRAATSTTTYTYSRHALDPDSGYQNVYSGMTRSFKIALGSMMKLDEQLSWKAAPTVRITAGGTIERFFAVPQGADLNAPVTIGTLPGTILNTDIPDLLVELRYFNTGAFGQAQWTIRPSMTATVGARVDHNTRYGTTMNPRAGLVFAPTSATTVKVLAGRAYLAPSPYQAYAHWGSFTTTDGGATYSSEYWHVPNPDLEPQRKTTLEASVAQTIASGLQVSVSAFYSRFTQLIRESDPDRAYSGTFLGWPVNTIDFAVNEGRARLAGGTVGADYLRVFDAGARLRANATLAFVDGVANESGSDDAGASLPMGAMTPLQARFSADLEYGRWSVAPRVTVEGPQRLQAMEDDGRRRTLPGYTRVDVHARRQIGPYLAAFATVENAFDVRYRHINARAYFNPEELIGSPQNPRRLTVGVSVLLGSGK